MAPTTYVRWFSDLKLADVPLVGGKTASLGELYSKLGSKGLNIPNGFAVTVAAYREALEQSGALARLHRLLDDLDQSSVGELALRAAEARKIVYEATNLPAIRDQIFAAY